jgi:4a-hydroxytetrahydrobiopterin dehydratase
MIKTLDETARIIELSTISEWEYDGARRAITRQFRFANFSEAFAFMTRVVMLAEAQDHHPNWSNVWNRVDILLTTHDAGGLSVRDIAMAKAIDALFHP